MNDSNNKSPDQQESVERSDRTSWGEIGRYSALGIEFSACIVIGLSLGLGFDSFFSTNPWGMFIGLAFGMVAAFRLLVRLVVNRKDKSD